ncbi:MAG TPA: hypothetical protein VIG72_14185 [Pontibacter sp.]
MVWNYRTITLCYSKGCWRGFATRVLFMVSDLQSDWTKGPNYSWLWKEDVTIKL